MADRPGHSLEDTLRRHDAAFYGWWDGLHVDYGTAGLGIEDNLDSPFAPINRDDFPILRVFATPQRAVAEVVDLLVHTGWIAGADGAAQAANAATLREKAGEDFAVLPLPILTIQRDDPGPNPQDSGPAKVFRKQCFDEANGAYQTQPWPGAYELTYRVTAWCVKRYTGNFIREWVLSQLGRPGANEMETFLPVVHNSPWGTINQAMSVVSIADQSQLEGDDNARILRHEYTFTLKMWHFKRPAPVPGVDPSQPGVSEGQVPAVQGFNLQEAVFNPGAPIGTEIDPNDFGEAPSQVVPSGVGLNMFSFYITPDYNIPTKWPKAGTNAAVRRGSKSPKGNTPYPTLRIDVTDSADEVLVSNRTVPLDTDGLAILTMAFDYTATEAVEIVTANKAAGAGQPFALTQVQPLPTRVPWTHGQFFMLHDQTSYSITARGTGTAAKLDLSQINLRHIHSPQIKTTPDSSVPGGGQTVHSFSGLDDHAYLAVVVFDSGAVADSIDVNGANYSVDPSVQTVGFVGIFTPTAGAATVTVPDSIPTTAVYLQRYEGPWDGTAV